MAAPFPVVPAPLLSLLGFPYILQWLGGWLLQSVLQVFTLAFLVVGATCVAMIPILLYMLDLRKYGWEWIHACMFGAMIASTDAVAIVSIMKTSERHLGFFRASNEHPGRDKLRQVHSQYDHNVSMHAWHVAVGGTRLQVLMMHAMLLQARRDRMLAP